LLFNAATCFGLDFWPSSGRFLKHVLPIFQFLSAIPQNNGYLILEEEGKAVVWTQQLTPTAK
jgi:hypothetical protein